MSEIIKENPVKLIGTGNTAVMAVYRDLMAAATGEDSIYLKAKDTIKELLIDDSALSDRAKVDLITRTLSEISLGVTTHAMDIAVKMCVEDRDSELTLENVEAGYELEDAQRLKLLADADVTDKKVDQIEQQINASVIDGWVIQAMMYRDTGYNPSNYMFDNIIIPAANTADDNCSKVAAAEKGYSDKYGSYADSIMQNGNVSYSVAGEGQLSNVVLSDGGMMYEQIRVAERQEKAFDDNMRQHVVNSSASMLGVMIGAEAFEKASSYKPYLDQWCSAVDFLNGSDFGGC
jgi:hypothetical protein